MIRLVILALLAYVAYRIIKTLLAGPGRTIHRGPDSGVIDEMVQDPFCTTYIPRKEAVRRVIEGKEHFFCTEECADKYERQRGRSNR